MHLFHCVNTETSTINNVTSVRTPLGNVRFEAIIGENSISSEMPTATFRLPGGGWVAGWYQQAFDLELLLCRPTLPPSPLPESDNSLTDCWAGVWRLHAYRPIASCIFVAAWDSDSTWEDGNPDGDEFLYAKTWNDAQTMVTIGTQDSEALGLRAEQNDYLPKEWGEYFRDNRHAKGWQDSPFWQHDVHAQLGYDGVATPLPSLPGGQRCQIHFFVAWADNREQSMVTGIAVDHKISEVLMEVDCR